MSTAERQRRHRDRLKEQGLTYRTIAMTDDEAFYLQRVLQQMRAHPTQKPAAMRDTATGRFIHLDI